MADNEIREIFEAVLFGHRGQFADPGFVWKFATALLKSDDRTFRLFRPAAVAMIEHYNLAA
jgi:hypothetical protein